MVIVCRSCKTDSLQEVIDPLQAPAPVRVSQLQEVRQMLETMNPSHRLVYDLHFCDLDHKVLSTCQASRSFATLRAVILLKEGLEEGVVLACGNDFLL